LYQNFGWSYFGDTAPRSLDENVSRETFLE
jgi:hypothetical protein